MPAPMDSGASTILPTSLAVPSDNAMTALSRLALGPVNTEYYLAVFERFDSTGRTTTTWNWAACLVTLNWMVFRQLWSAALVYVAAAEGTALVMLALGRTFFHWPMGVELGMLGALALLAFAVPGLYGNAILYADVRKRVMRALAVSRTLPQACALLQQQASTPKRLQALVLANVALATAAVLAYLFWPSQPSSSASAPAALSLEPAVTVAQATASAAAAASARSSAPLPGLAASVAGPAGPQAPAHGAAEHTAREAASTTPATGAPLFASAATPDPNVRASASVPAAPIAAPRPASAAARTGASGPSTTPPERAAKAAAIAARAPASRGATPDRSTVAKAAKASASVIASAAPAAVGSDTEPAVGTVQGYYINVGLFAEEANARKAQARLLNEGLPAFRQELNSAKGRRIRVRVGPYESRAQADAAAASIRAMALEATVFKQ